MYDHDIQQRFVNMYDRALNHGDFSPIYELCAPDVSFLTPTGRIDGIDQVIGVITAQRQAFDRFRYDIEFAFASPEGFGLISTLSGRHTRELFQILPSHKEIRARNISIHRLARQKHRRLDVVLIDRLASVGPRTCWTIVKFDSRMITVISNVHVFDGESADIAGGSNVVIEGDRIREVTSRREQFASATVIDGGGRVLLPGLIDAHFHAYTPTFNFELNDRMPPSLMASHAARILEGALSRGFTSVRDAGGGDIGLALAIEQGLIDGPRFFFSGKAISQTGGHGDARPADAVGACGCAGYSGFIARVADGADSVRLAVRDELRRGATQIKLFVSGGVVSPTDPIWMPQLTDEEIAAAVHEAATRRTYVMAHVHTDDAARRCADLGVRTIEHGTMIEEPTARILAEKGCYVVPTLSVARVIAEHGSSIGVPPMALDKIKVVADQTRRAIEYCIRSGVKLGLGTDLLDHRFHPMQGGELALRAEMSSPLDVLRSVISINAEILRKPGELGCIKPGAYADLLLVNGDPLADLSLFSRPEQGLAFIMKGGRVVKHAL